MWKVFNYLGILSLKLAYPENCLFCLSKHSFVWRNCCKDVAIEHQKINKQWKNFTKQCCLNFCSHPPKCSLLHNNAKHIIKTQSKLMARSHCLSKSLAGVSVNLWNVYCMCLYVGFKKTEKKDVFRSKYRKMYRTSQEKRSEGGKNQRLL